MGGRGKEEEKEEGGGEEEKEEGEGEEGESNLVVLLTVSSRLRGVAVWCGRGRGRPS